MNRWKAAAAIVVCLALSPTNVFATEGALEISSACVASGCFDGDSPGFPVTITKPGNYVFTSNLKMNEGSGSAIQINTDNVVIDLKGFILDGSGAGAATFAKGIFGLVRRNVTVRNGTIQGFFLAVLLEDGTPPHNASGGHIVERIRADKNTVHSLWVDGTGNLVRDNLLLRTGNSTTGTDALVDGIKARGRFNRFINNEIAVVTPLNQGNGIYLINADGSVVEGNRIFGIEGGPTTSFAIRIESSDDVLVVNNRVGSVYNGVFYDSSTGKYRDNLTSNATSPFTGGTDAGGNN